MTQAADEIDRLRAQLAEARGVLEFYADEDGYWWDETASTDENSGPAIVDGGERARQFLEATGEEGEDGQS